MSDRVSAKIVIGGRAPAASLDALLDAIETEGLGPDWGEVFDDRPGMLAHIRANIDGVEGFTMTVGAVAVPAFLAAADTHLKDNSVLLKGSRSSRVITTGEVFAGKYVRVVRESE